MATFDMVIYEGERRYRAWTLGNDDGCQVELSSYWLDQFVRMGVLQASDVESIVVEYWQADEREPVFRRMFNSPVMLTDLNHYSPTFRPVYPAGYGDAPGGYGFNGEQPFEQWQTEQWERSGQ